jgi:hypothetical protein
LAIIRGFRFDLELWELASRIFEASKLSGSATIVAAFQNASVEKAGEISLIR